MTPNDPARISWRELLVALPVAALILVALYVAIVLTTVLFGP